MPKISVSDEEVIALGKKLDEFGEVLTETEQMLLLAMIRAARQYFQSAGTPGTPPPQPKPGSGRTRLGAAFDAAFIPGRAAEFENQSEIKIGPVEITGSVTATVK